jgi:hypothetical protein
MNGTIRIHFASIFIRIIDYYEDAAEILYKYKSVLENMVHFS